MQSIWHRHWWYGRKFLKVSCLRALMGVLQQLYELGTCLISVDCTSIVSGDE